jgi:GntR family transcriptional regulator
MIGSVRSNSKTLTEAAQQQIRQAIIRGTYRPGSQLPGEMELVEMLGVSRTVVREALRVLEEDGLITRRHGVGTFVRKSPILNNLSLDFGTTEMIQAAGMEPGTSFFDIRVEPASPEVAEGLQVEVGLPVVTIERVRTADGRTVVYSLDCLPQANIGDIDQVRRLAATEQSLYQILQAHFGLIIDYGIARIVPIAAPEDVARWLNTQPGSVLMYLIQTDYSPQDQAILFSREYHIADAFDFLILRRGPVRSSEALAVPRSDTDGNAPQ